MLPSIWPRETSGLYTLNVQPRDCTVSVFVTSGMGSLCDCALLLLLHPIIFIVGQLPKLMSGKASCVNPNLNMQTLDIRRASEMCQAQFKAASKFNHPTFTFSRKIKNPHRESHLTDSLPTKQLCYPCRLW